MAVAIINVTVILLNMVKEKTRHLVGESEITLLSYILSARVGHIKIVVDSSVVYIYFFSEAGYNFY